MVIFMPSMFYYVTIKMIVIARAPLFPTESAEKIKHAFLALFPDMHVDIRGDFVQGEGASIDAFRLALKKQKIRDTARAVMFRGRADTGLETRFAISKQASTVGKVNFAENESPLGDIEITLRTSEGERLDDIIDDIAPSTGKEVKPHDQLDALNDTKHYIQKNIGWETALATGKPKKSSTKGTPKTKRHIRRSFTKGEIRDELENLDKSIDDEPEIGEEYSEE